MQTNYRNRRTDQLGIWNVITASHIRSMTARAEFERFYAEYQAAELRAYKISRALLALLLSVFSSFCLFN